LTYLIFYGDSEYVYLNYQQHSIDMIGLFCAYKNVV